MLDFGASERRISNFPRPSLPLSASSPSVSLSVGRSVMPSETSEAPHSHLPPPPCTIHDPSPVHTRRDQIKRCADRFSACWPFLGPLPPLRPARRRPGALPTTDNAAFTQKAFIIPPSLRFWPLSSLFSSILPPSLSPCSALRSHCSLPKNFFA